MIYLAAPALCSTFKGILPSDLVSRYGEASGMARMEFDMHVAAEIGEQINQASNKKGSMAGQGNAARERMMQRRARRKA